MDFPWTSTRQIVGTFRLKNNKSILCLLLLVVLIRPSAGLGQEQTVLTLSEYLGYVKKYHPIVKQANLVLKESEAKYLQARGAFDPKIKVNYDQKQFQTSEYYSKLNTTFTIPVWYGVDVKGGFVDRSGDYLNPEANVPITGLYAAGGSLSLARGLLINERRAVLKQAKLYRTQATADNQQEVNNILYQAVQAYFQWLRVYNERQVYTEFLANAQLRYESVQRSYDLGERPEIDTNEARITYNDRRLKIENAQLKYIKASLRLSNYLWIEDVPVEVAKTTVPNTEVLLQIDSALGTNLSLGNFDLSTHPKIRSLNLKLRSLEVEKRLRRNQLLPVIDLKYHFISGTPNARNTWNITNYEAGLNLELPMLMRKARARLKFASYKLRAVRYETQSTMVVLKNKIGAVEQEVTSYQQQLSLIKDMGSDYRTLLKAEERKFDIGESSLFLVNSREARLIENKLKAIEVENALLNAKGKLFNTLGLGLAAQ